MSRTNTAPRIQLASFEEMLGAPQTAPSAQPQTLPIDSLKSYPNHKYELYTGEKLAAMVESIKEHGIIQPIIVWHKDGKYIILAGHNHVNAAKIAELLEVPVIIKENLAEDEARFIVNESSVTLHSICHSFPNPVGDLGGTRGD